MATHAFKKALTRDNNLIIQTAWEYALTKGFADRLGVPLESDQANVYFVIDGVVEIWEQEAHYEWLLDTLLEANQQNPDLLAGIYAEHMQTLAELKNLQENAPATDLDRLIGLLHKGSAEFVIMYYALSDSRTPAEGVEIARRFRDTDRFYDDFDVLLRQSMQAAYPETKGNEFVILEPELLSGKLPNEDVLRERMRHFVFIPDRAAEAVELTDFLAKHPEYEFEIDGTGRAEVLQNGLRGNGAYRGKATGPVRILKRKDQVADLQEGEILVSPMTTPAYVPAVHRAAAIVTDEGGITCHAAIIARELQKPCLIATKVASKVLRDGDMVEVDAEAGRLTVLQTAA